MACEVRSWMPVAVASALRDDRSTAPLVDWLRTIRLTVEEYDPLVTIRPPPDRSEDAFDAILSQLGTEIYKLDEYQRNLVPAEKEVSLSILDIFDECLRGMEVTAKMEPVPTDCILNGDSDCESSLSDVSFVTSTPVRCEETKMERSAPIPMPRKKIDVVLSAPEVLSRFDSDSDSESTCWSYKECGSSSEQVKAYAMVWSHSSGFHNSDEILRRVLAQHHATESRVAFETARELSPPRYSVYALLEVTDRCTGDARSVAAMTPDQADGYEPVRDALTDENIYEEIEYGCSYTDEGCSCGTNDSRSPSASTDRDSPLYANLRDHDAYAVPPDVIFWKNLLSDPYYNEDEEDEWITPEECAVYNRERRPPLVIPRITQYRALRRDNRPQNFVAHGYEESAKEWSPASERSAHLERGYGKVSADSPPFVRINKKLGGSTENLIVPNLRPNHIHLPASSSGDSLDVEVREREPSYARSRKSRSMVAHKRSPVPAPRRVLPPVEAFDRQTVEPAAQSASSVVDERPLKRTKYSESGKKSKKNWSDSYMVLTNTALYFYKDQRTYNATKIRKPGTPPSPTAPRAELILPLRNAHVLPCIQSHTRRYTRSFMLTVGYDTYLLQDETDEKAKHLLKLIQGIIYKLGPPTLDEYPGPQYQSSNTDLESLGRTPPVTRHYNRTKKDEPVFGRKLEEVCAEGSPRVPEFVRACVREIESSEENMCTDGLYRASGNLSQVQKIRLEIDQKNQSVISNNTDIHVLTGALKLFFRELKEPLIPCTMFDRILAACSIKPRDARIKEFRDIVHTLPDCNRDTLKFLLEHLLRVTQYSERNRMHTANLAIVFGPTLLWAPAEQAHNIAIDCIQQNNVVDILLNDYHEIFDGKKKA
ncbi:rho GTPase-activating protein 12-like isoform X2 [Battus philenor]|uniref:rho GTPase-activating protein 12-like isoform X2 n=1 Tax=Battus philenor TaxID=42288 RepID=UPI0035D015D6